MFKWLKARREKKAKARREAGYQYAMLTIDQAGEKYGVQYLEDQVDCARTFGGFDDFDRGIEDAIAETRQRTHGAGVSRNR